MKCSLFPWLRRFIQLVLVSIRRVADLQVDFSFLLMLLQLKVLICVFFAPESRVNFTYACFTNIKSVVWKTSLGCSIYLRKIFS